MAGAMKNMALVLGACGLLLSLDAVAGGGSDPTRPPAAFVGEGAQESGEEIKPLVLQSVVIPRGGRPSAVISGQAYALGSKVGEGRLVRITESSVTIRGNEGVKNLSLTPDVEKTMIKEKGAAKATRKTRE